MLKGLIIYYEEDVEKNRRFISLCKENLKEDDILLELKVIEHETWQSVIPEIDTGEISFVINRSRNYMLSETLEHAGVRVFNNSKVTEIGNDKWKTYELAKKLGIPVMNTECCNKECSSRIQYPKVIKSCKGHGGNEVFLVHNDSERKSAVSKIQGGYIIQDYADAGGKDIRAYVLGGRCVVAMCRTAGSGFKSNFSLGGKAEKYELNEQERNLVKKICDELHPDYIGVDFMYDGKRLVLNEIEDAVGARMVYENTDLNIVKEFTDDIKAVIMEQ